MLNQVYRIIKNQKAMVFSLHHKNIGGASHGLMELLFYHLPISADTRQYLPMHQLLDSSI